jgi:transposase
MGLSQIEAEQRMELYEQGLSYKDIAKALNIPYSTIINWFHTRGLKAHRQQDLSGESERRYQAYLETNTDKEAAFKLGLKIETYYAWRRAQGLPAKNEQAPQRKDNSYVSTRPQWERDRIRHFGSRLNNVGHVKDPDVMGFIEEYRCLYGEGGE